MGADRLAVLGIFCLVFGSAGVASATAPSPTVTPAVGVPTGAAAPTSTLFPLASVGYQAAEFFLAGNASSYHNVIGPPFLADGVWTIEADATTAAYKTRIQVYRPIDPAAFDGTVYVEWLNVTNLSDTAADWTLGHVEMIREGAAYVGVTTQLVGWNAAVNNDPDRYGPTGANLIHPGDSYSYDIFSQAGQALHDNAALILGGLAPEAIIAFGESQSASRMITYVDALHTLHHVYDGYMLHSRGAGGTQLRGTPPGPNIAVPTNTLIRTDLGVPVFVFQSETDTRATRQADSSTFRQWEVAGTAHVDMYTLGIGQFDDGLTGTAPLALFDRMLNPTNDPLPGLLPPCGLPVNSGPHHWTFQAATRALHDWVRSGTLPPTAPPLATVGGPTTALVLDANGNATGGVRSPHVDAPVATIRGTGQSGTGFCFLFGTTTPLTTAQLQALYTKQSLFVAAWNQAADAAISHGWILAADAARLKAPAALRQVVPKIPLTVSAHFQTVPIGSPDPAFTSSIDGFVLGDTAATLDTPPTCEVAGPHAAVGTYPITCSGGADDDYSFAYVPATLEVTYSIAGGGGCGIGPELALLVPMLAWLHRRRAR